MNRFTAWLRVALAALVMLAGTTAPAMACAEMAPLAMALQAPEAMAHQAPGAMQHQAPEAMPRCDMVCLAYLVQPAPLRIAQRSSRSVDIEYSAPTTRFDAVGVLPDLPPPRPARASIVEFPILKVIS